MTYKGYIIEARPHTVYVLYINGKKAEQGCLLLDRFSDPGPAVKAGKDLVDEVENGTRVAKESKRYIQFHIP